MHSIPRAAALAALVLASACGGRQTADGPDASLSPDRDGGDARQPADASTPLADGCPGTVEASLPSLDAGAGTADATGPLDGGAVDSSHRAPGCPLVAPHQGDPCTPATAPSFGERWPCEYGDDPHCTTVALCFESSAGTSTWQISPPNPACNPNPTCCPSSFDPGTGRLYDPGPPTTPTTCPFQGSCTYPEGRCSCLPCTVGGGGSICGEDDLCADAEVPGTTWICETWPQPSGCPWPRPLLGTPCNLPETMYCGYGPTCCDYVGIGEPPMQCIGGYWDLSNSGC